MTPQTIFALQFVMSLIVWATAFTLFLNPRLAELERRRALQWLLLPHAFRHIGMVFLVPGVVDRTLPEAFGPAAAYGDLSAALLAVGAIFALQSSERWGSVMTWTFSVVGLVDLTNALRQPEPIPMFGAAWYIPTMLVPLLLVTHFWIIRRLLAGESRPATGRGAATAA